MISTAYSRNVLRSSASSSGGDVAGSGPDSRTTDVNKLAADRTAVALAVLRLFAEHELEFAYPTQTTFTAAPDGTYVMPYATPPAP